MRKYWLLAGLALSVALHGFGASYTWEVRGNGDGTCALTGVKGSVSGKIVLPSEVDGLKVTSIDEEFEFDEDDELNITELVIPDTVTEFYRNSFADIGSWKKPITVTLPHTLEHIWQWGNDDQIDWCVFNTECLANVKFSNGSTSNDAGTYRLVGDGNRMLVHCEESGKTNLIALAGNLGRSGNHYKSPETITVPDGITSIAADVFDDMDRTSKISLPESLVELRRDIGFGWVNNLEEIEVRGTASPYKVIGNSLVDTRTKTLMQATKNTVIPNDGSITRIASYSCINDLIKELVFPDAIEEIADYAAASTDGIEVFRIGKGTRVIGGGAFRSASADKLKCISISPENPYYEVVNGCVIRKSDNVFVSTAIAWQTEKVYDDEWMDSSWIYDVEVPYFCTGILPESLDEDDSVRTAVLPKNLVLEGWYSWYDPIRVVKGICIADCTSEDEAKNSATYKDLKEKGYLNTDEELTISYTSNPQVAVRTVGAVTVQGYGRYMSGKNVTLKTPYVEDGKQAVWYKVDRENNTSQKVATGNTYPFTMPSDNVFYSVELIDLPKVTVAIVGDTNAGKVTGEGVYAADKKVTLKATANKGYIFSGWYTNTAGNVEAEVLASQAPSYTFVMPEGDVNAKAKFIALADDKISSISIDTVEEEYAPKQAINSIAVNVESTSLPTITVKGLPAGLKFTTKEVKVGADTIPANTIYGTPTKSGVYTTTISAVTVSKKSMTESVTFVVKAEGENVLKIAVQEDGDGNALGKVTGAGVYAAGKKATLKATANKGYVFAGWYTNTAGNVEAEVLASQAPSYTFVMPEGDVNAKAKFIALADDKISSISIDTVEEEYAPKQAINSIAVNVESTSLPTITVKGLPAGLKFTTKEVKVGADTIPANTIYGTPTKSGVYTTTISATTVSKKTMAESVTFIVKAEGEKVLQIVAQQVDESDNALGKVTGTGVYADGKKATLKATANKGYVFAGWYTDPSFCCPLVSEEVDYRTPSLSYTVSTNESAVSTLYARFVTKEEDKANSVTITNLDQYHEMNSDTELPALVLESYSLPKVTVSGLPAGLKFDAKTRTFSGTPTKPGKYTVKFNLSNTSAKTTIETDIYVENLKGADALLTIMNSEGVDVSEDWNGHFYSISVGVSQPWHYRLGQDDSFTYPTTEDVLEYELPLLKAKNDDDKVTLSGLPASLKYNAEKGTIEGVATKAGYYTVYVTVKSGKASSISTFVIHVYELPTWAVGTFVGSCDYVVNTTNSQERGMFRLEVTVAANGKITGKAVYPYVDTKGKRSFKTTTFSESSFESGNSANCFYVETSADFKWGTKTLTRTFNLSIGPDTYKEGESIGIMSVYCCNVETDGSLELFGYDLVQNALKIKSLTKPEFANNAKTVKVVWDSFASAPVPNVTEDAYITKVDLTIKPNGSVVAVVEGEDAEGQAFKPRKLTSELIIWGFGAEDYPDCWYATTLLNSDGYVMGVDLALPVNDEGKVKVDECEVVDVYFVNPHDEDDEEMVL